MSKLGPTMPYESPNIIIIPTTGFQKGKTETPNASDLTKATLPDGEMESNTPKVLVKPQTEVAIAIPKDSVQVATYQNVQDVVQSGLSPKSDCVIVNNTLEDSNKKPYTSSWASNYLQSIGQHCSTITTKPSILRTSNDSREQNVSSTSERKKIATRDEYKNVASMDEKSNGVRSGKIKNFVSAEEKKNVARADGRKDVDSAKSNVSSIGDKKPPIKINLLSSKVAKTADITATPAMVHSTEHLDTGTRPYNDITWNSPLMPRTGNESWISTTPYQPTYPILNTAYCVPIEGMLSQQYPTNIYTQNTNTNIMNTNHVHQRENHPYTHYYTPSYKSPMDSAWLNEQYYAQLVNDQSYKYFNQINRYENIYTKVPVIIGNTPIIDKTSCLDKISSPVTDEIMKPNKSDISSKINKEKDCSEKSIKIIPKNPINPDSFNLGNDFVETTSHNESEAKKKTRESSGTKSKKSTFKELPKIDKTGSCKSKLSSKSESSESVKEMLRKQINKIENLIAKKRKRSPDKTLKVDARDGEDCPTKKKKLSNDSEHDKQREQDRDSKNKSIRLRETIETRPEPNRKRMRRSSNSEYQPKKRSRRNSDNDDTRSKCSNHVNFIKSVVKTSQIKHPRTQAPESDEFDSDDDSKSNFDLRSILSRANYNYYIRKKAYCDSQSYDKPENERENLLITINQNEDNNDLQPKAVPAKTKPKSKKYKKIQFVINVICDKQDSSENSSSDETNVDTENSTIKIIDTGSVFKSDLSFLDDINVDEIVNCLNQQKTVVNANKFDASKNVKESVVSENNKNSEKPRQNFVQPIIIKSEIKTEHEDPEQYFVCSHEGAPENILTDDTVNVGLVNNVSEQSIECVRNDTQEANCLDVIQNIKQEKSFEIEDKAKSEKVSGCPEGRQSPTIQELVSALSEKYSKPANQDNKPVALENTDRSTPEVLPTVKCELPENDEDIVNEENKLLGLTTANDQINIDDIHEPIIASLVDEDTQELQTYSACEPMDIDKTSTFCIPDMQIPIREENNNVLNMCCESKNTASINDRSLTGKDKAKPVTEDCQLRITEDNSVTNAVATNSIVTVQNDIVQLSENNKPDTKETLNFGTHSIPNPGQVETGKKEEKSEASVTTETVVNIEAPKVENSENVKIDTIATNLEIGTEVSTPINIKINTQNSETVATVTYTKQDENKEVAATPLPDTSINISNPVNVSTPKTADKVLLMDNSVKSKNDIEIKIEKLPQINKLPNKTNTAKKVSLPTSPNKGKVAKQENKDNIVKPTTVVKPESTIPQKVDATKKDANEKSAKSTDKPRTVQIKPSLKPNKILALKIEERTLEVVNLNISVTSVIHSGKYSKIFKCESANGKQYALKFIKDEANRPTLGMNKKNMLLALQKDIPTNNLNTVFMISSFGVDRNWCFLTEYYPKDLHNTLKTTVFDMDTVQELSRQLVSAVMVMRNNNIVHSDIKPHHILLDAANKRLKVCGFDEAYYMEKLQKVIPNIGSASYRAPEVIVGYSADFAIDVWATALVIFEMISGRKLITAQGFNNNILFCQMSILGYLPMDMIAMSRYYRNHFVGTFFKRIMGGQGQFVLYNSQNFALKKRVYPILKGTTVQRWTKDLNKRNIKSDMKKLSKLCYMLDNMLAIDPRQRITIEHVYADPFFMYKNAQTN